jgi:DNA topoisomerase-1
MEPTFTAKMEEDLDEVAAGKLERVKLLTRFYGKFRETLDKAKKEKRWTPEPKMLGEACPECGKGLYERWSKNGWFVGCEGYPKCKFTRSLGENGPAEVRMTDYKCEQCGKPLTIRTGRYGEFLSCSGYPECKTTRPMPLGVPCPKCGRDVVEVRSRKKGGKAFYGCVGYPECDFKLWQKPVAEACPNCNAPYLLRMGGEKNPKLVCANKECGYSRKLELEGDSEDGPAEAASPSAS